MPNSPICHLFSASTLACLLLTLTTPTLQAAEWKKRVVVPPANSMINSAVANDFDGDGAMDVLSSYDGRVVVLRGPAWKPHTLHVFDASHSRNKPRTSCIHSCLMDVDGDGDLDFCGSNNTVFWLECPDRPLSGKSWTYRTVDDEILGTHCLITGDVNRDGRVDLIANSGRPAGKTAIPDSLTWLEVPKQPHAATHWVRHVFADRDAPGGSHYTGFGDVNGDGRPDISCGAKGGEGFPGGEWFAWWEQPADATQSWKKHALSAKQPGATNIHPVDVNRDGTMDFVATRGHGQGVLWFKGPDFTPIEIDAEIEGPHCLATIDLDGDGDVDIATCGRDADGLAVWYENDGRGTFERHLIGRDQGSYDIRTVDVDGDRDLDILIAGHTSKNIVWYENPNAKTPLFDMGAIRDASTLDIEVVQDWHRVEGQVPTRQKLVTINVGEMWPGQKYRMPVRMVVPADRKAKGFHLTGGNSPGRLKQDAKIFALDQELINGGVGLVQTVVQVLQASGLGELGDASEARFLKTLDPHDKIQYWAWPATMMRAVTTAYAEADHFEVGKVAMSGGSKNGATPSMAIIHDKRMTAVHASVSPIWDSPLRLCDRKAWDQLEAVTGPFRHPFLGGHFGPIYNRRALEAGRSWEELEELARDISEGVFITRNIDALRARKVDLLFHPGTHDFVAFDIAWGGKHHPTIPIYLRANSGHGQRKRHPAVEPDERNKAAFLLNHFFDDVDPLLESPAVEQILTGTTLKVTVRFKPGSGEESGRIWWINDRAPDGSPEYLSKLIPDDNWADMKHDKDRGVWRAAIEIDPKADRIDFFSNHRKTIRYGGKSYPTYISCPYTRVELSERRER